MGSKKTNPSPNTNSGKGAPRASVLVETASHIGQRDEQQDASRVMEFPGQGFAVVADGMGGHAGGKAAAEAAIAAVTFAYICEKFDGSYIELPVNPTASLPHGAGSTIVGLQWVRSVGGYKLRFFSVGDSYGLLLGAGKAPGVLGYSTPIEGWGHVLSNYWSGQHRYRWASASPWIPIKKKQTVILASDGLDPIMGNLPDVLRVTDNSITPNKDADNFLDLVRQRPVGEIVQAAVQAGGQHADNTTVVRLTFQPGY
jgi:hypothetical protein